MTNPSTTRPFRESEAKRKTTTETKRKKENEKEEEEDNFAIWCGGERLSVSVCDVPNKHIYRRKMAKRQ